MVGLAAQTVYPICNPADVLGKKWVNDMYQLGYGQKLALPAGADTHTPAYTAADCRSFLVDSRQYNQFWNSADKLECQLTVAGTQTALWFMGPVAQQLPLCNGLISRDTNACRVVLQNDHNEKNGLNLNLVWPTNGLAFDVQMNNKMDGPNVQQFNIKQGIGQRHQYTPFQLGTQTHWTELTIEVPDQSAIDNVYKIPSDLFDTTIKFTSKGFDANNYIFNFSKPMLKTLKQNANLAWGITTPACVPPTLTFRVSFAQSTQIPNTDAADMYQNMRSKFTGIRMNDAIVSAVNGGHYSRRLLALNESETISETNTRRRLLHSKVPCWQQVTELIAIAPQMATTGYTCRMDFHTISIRNSLLSPSTLKTAADLGTTATTLVTNALIANAKYAVTTAQEDGPFIAISTSYAARVVSCAGSTLHPGNWLVALTNNVATNVPGECKMCSATTTPNARVVPCALNAIAECCHDCMQGFISVETAAGDKCAKRCPGTAAYTLPIAVCQSCMTSLTGNVQNISSGTKCAPCSALLGPNSVANPTTGTCHSCGMLQYAKTVTSCAPCPDYHYVPADKTECEACGPGTVMQSVQDYYRCVPCLAGTYQNGNDCTPCMPHTIAAHAGCSICTPCQASYQTIGLNRTACVPCISTSLPLNVVYSRIPGDGCLQQCAPNTFARTTGAAYIPGGCVSCSLWPVAVGAYPDATDCTIQHRCTNAPSTSGVVYLTSGRSATGCEWGCRPGYHLQASACKQCTPTDVTPPFNASVHVWVSNVNSQCQSACKPLLYSSTTGACLPCVDLYPTNAAAVAISRLYSRVRYYNASFRAPRWITGHCGNNATVPSKLAISSSSNTLAVANEYVFLQVRPLCSSKTSDGMRTTAETRQPRQSAATVCCSWARNATTATLTPTTAVAPSASSTHTLATIVTSLAPNALKTAAGTTTCGRWAGTCCPTRPTAVESPTMTTHTCQVACQHDSRGYSERSGRACVPRRSTRSSRANSVRCRMGAAGRATPHSTTKTWA